MTALFVFLYKNGKWINVDTQELYDFTMWIAKSLPSVKDGTEKAIEQFIKIHITPL